MGRAARPRRQHDVAQPLAVLADGKVLIAYRGTKCCCNSLIGAWNVTGGHELETMGLLRADTWDGPFVRDGVKIFGEGTDNEDPYLWTSPRGVHMLMHSQDNAHHNHERRGAYAYSPDGVTWRLSSEEAWPTHLAYDDCGADAVVKRQRPSLALDATTGRPTPPPVAPAKTEPTLATPQAARR